MVGRWIYTIKYTPQIYIHHEPFLETKTIQKTQDNEDDLREGMYIETIQFG